MAGEAPARGPRGIGQPGDRKKDERDAEHLRPLSPLTTRLSLGSATDSSADGCSGTPTLGQFEWLGRIGCGRFGALGIGYHRNGDFNIFEGPRKRLERAGEGYRGMAVGGLIGAYQEDDNGALHALLPLAGRTLVEYQVRCLAAAGAAPIVIVVERVPQALQDVFERLRLDSLSVFPVSDLNEALSRFKSGSSILLIGDGVAPPRNW